MQLRKALDALPCALRVIISGTPIQVPWGLVAVASLQLARPTVCFPASAALEANTSTPSSCSSCPAPQNNLMEMWALFNFVAPDVLGEPADFRWVLCNADGWGKTWCAFDEPPT